MRKIYIIIDNVFHYAGTEKVCEFMVKSLGGKYEITIISLKGSPPAFYDFSKSYQIISLDGCKYPIIDAIKILKKKKPNSVLLISMGRLSILFAFASKMLCAKSSLEKTKFITCEHVSLASYKKSIKIAKLIFLRFYDEVIVLTETDKIELAKFKIKSKVIPNAVKHNNYSRIKPSHTVLSVGRLEKQKGFDILLRMWKSFSLLNPTWKLLIAGEGTQKESLINLAIELQISDSVKFLGLVNNIEDCFKSADIYAMTSRYEGLPLVLLEAKSWSLPCIAFDCPTGPKEIIDDNRDGYLIPIDDEVMYLEKLHILANDELLRRTFSHNTKVTYKKFDEHNIKNKWLALVR